MAATEICSLVLVRKEGNSWLKFGMLEDAKEAKLEGCKARGEIRHLVHPIA